MHWADKIREFFMPVEKKAIIAPFAEICQPVIFYSPFDNAVLFIDNPVTLVVNGGDVQGVPDNNPHIVPTEFHRQNIGNPALTSGGGSIPAQNDWQNGGVNMLGLDMFTQMAAQIPNVGLPGMASNDGILDGFAGAKNCPQCTLNMNSGLDSEIGIGNIGNQGGGFGQGGNIPPPGFGDTSSSGGTGVGGVGAGGGLSTTPPVPGGSF